MSNTYAKIETKDLVRDSRPYSTNMKLTLTAFMSKEKHTQLTVQTDSTIEGQSGTSYITLGDKEVDLLITALLERKLRTISATGNEQSIFCPNDAEDEPTSNI